MMMIGCPASGADTIPVEWTSISRDSGYALSSICASGTAAQIGTCNSSSSVVLAQLLPKHSFLGWPYSGLRFLLAVWLPDP